MGTCGRPRLGDHASRGQRGLAERPGGEGVVVGEFFLPKFWYPGVQVGGEGGGCQGGSGSVWGQAVAWSAASCVLPRIQHCLGTLQSPKDIFSGSSHQHSHHPKCELALKKGITEWGMGVGEGGENEGSHNVQASHYKFKKKKGKFKESNVQHDDFG